MLAQSYLPILKHLHHYYLLLLHITIVVSLSYPIFSLFSFSTCLFGYYMVVYTDDEFGEKTVSVLLDGEESEIVFIDHPSSEMSVSFFLFPFLFVLHLSFCIRNFFPKRVAITMLWFLFDTFCITNELSTMDANEINPISQLLSGRKTLTCSHSYSSRDREREREFFFHWISIFFSRIAAHSLQVENSLSTYEPHACVIVYSVVQRSSFQQAENIVKYLWRENVTKEKAVILVGNKADLVREIGK